MFAIYSEFLPVISLGRLLANLFGVTRLDRLTILRAIAPIRFPVLLESPKRSCRIPVDAKKKRPAFSSGALLCSAEDALVNFDKVRIARADHPLRVYEAVHVNRDPAAIHEREVRVPDQPEMVLPKSLDEELFRMPPKTEHFAMTRLELLHVHLRRLIHVRLIRAPHVRLMRARTRTRFTLVHIRSATLNFLRLTLLAPLLFLV
jgi:hypothetical protein